MKTPKMVKRHLKSILGKFDIDLEKDDELKETKTEINDKVRKILKIIKDKDEDSINQNTEENLNNEPLVAFIEDMQKHYESLYDRYDHLTTSLRKKIHSTKGKDSSSTSSSSSSDSDSDNSSKINGRKSRKLKKEEAARMKIEFDNLKDENSKLLGENSKLLDENSKLLVENTDLNSSVEEKSKVLSEYISQIQNLNEELVQMKDLQLKVDSLNSDKKELEEKLKDKFYEYDELECQINDYVTRIEKLYELVEDLKEEVDIKKEDINSLVESVSNSEVKFRLSNQKLKITEQVLNEAEELHKKKEEKLIEQNSLLQERIKKHKQEQEKTVMILTTKLSDTFNLIDRLTVKFEEDFGHIESCVYEISNEVKVAKRWVRDKNDEKTKLARDSEVRDEKLKEMKREMREKDDEIFGLKEEKFEVIRQLCVCIDYYRSECDYLKKVVFDLSGGRRKAKA